MAREDGIHGVNPQSILRQTHIFIENEPITASQGLNHFESGNITGVVIYVKATSASGTPDYTLSLQTSPTESDFLTVNAMSDPDLEAVTDEVGHMYLVNCATCHAYSRIFITLNGGDPGDTVFTVKLCFLYGSFTHTSDVTLEGDINIAPGTSLSDKTSILSYQEANSVVDNVTTTILSLAPATDKYITQIECSGDDYGKFGLYIDSVLKAVKRGGPQRNVSFDFTAAPITLSSGSTMDVKVTHFYTGETPDFECSVIGF